jgi:hypothetical protein
LNTPDLNDVTLLSERIDKGRLLKDEAIAMFSLSLGGKIRKLSRLGYLRFLERKRSLI